MHLTRIDGLKAREIMDNEGLSVTEVSRRMGVTRMTVYNLLDNKNTSLDLLTAFCVALNNTNPLDILKTEGFPDPLVEASAGMAT